MILPSSPEIREQVLESLNRQPRPMDPMDPRMEAFRRAAEALRTPEEIDAAYVILRGAAHRIDEPKREARRIAAAEIAPRLRPGVRVSFEWAPGVRVIGSIASVGRTRAAVLLRREDGGEKFRVHMGALRIEDRS